jgi:branched-chain amino acid transport system substrate-binding protein
VFVRVLALCLFAALAAFSPARADDALIVGVMNDQSGPYADLSGPGGAAIARMAIEDFGVTVLGKPIELLVADHQNKVDVGLQIARPWYDERRVGDLRHNQFRRRACASGPRQCAQPHRHL